MAGATAQLRPVMLLLLSSCHAAVGPGALNPASDGLQAPASGAAAAAAVRAEPSMATFWAGDAHFEFVSKARFVGPDGQFGMNVGFDFVVAADGTWHVFHREYGYDSQGTRPPACKRDRARIVVRNSSDEGRTWSAATVILSPGNGSGPAGCALVDGGAFWDAATQTWHYLSQCLAPPGACKTCGGWQLCHYSTVPGEPNPAVADWRPSFNISSSGAPSVAGGQLWSAICAGKGKHCSVKGGSDNVGTVDEGTPQIVRKDSDGYFWVTFHGWDPHTVRSARGVARTRHFIEWQVRKTTLFVRFYIKNHHFTKTGSGQT